MLNSIHELPSHLDQEKLPEWINDGLLKGGIYALKTQSSATASLAISQALGENFTREVECIVVTAIPYNEILCHLHRSRSRLLSDAVENGSLKIFSPVGDYRKNIFRFGPERFLSELEQFCACRDSLIIFDHADSLFTAEDSEIVAAQADAYRKWMRKTQNIALFLFQDSIELSPGSPYFRSLANHFSGIAGIYMFRNRLEVGVDFWTTLDGTLLSQPLAVRSRVDGSIDIRPSLAVNRRSRSRLKSERSEESRDMNAGTSHTTSNKMPTHDNANEDIIRVADAKEVVSCLRSAAFETFQQRQNKAAPLVNADNVSAPSSKTDEDVSAPISFPVKNDNSAPTSQPMNNFNFPSKKKQTNVSQRVALTFVAFMALGIIGVGMKHSWDYATVDVFKSYPRLIEKLHAAQNALNEKISVAHSTDVIVNPTVVEHGKTITEKVSRSSPPAVSLSSSPVASLSSPPTPVTASGISVTNEDPVLEVKAATETPAVAKVSQVEPAQQQLNQNHILPDASVLAITSKSCPEQLQAMKLCSNDSP